MTLRRTHHRRPVAGAAAVGLVVTALMTGAQSPVAGAAGPARPNLTTVSVTDPPRKAEPGDTFTIRSTVKNAGRGEAGASHVRVLMSKDKIASDRDLTVASGRIKALRPRRSVTVDASVTVPEGAKGSYHLLTCADSRRKVRETDERDNCRASAKKVAITGALDLDLTGTLTFVDVGESVGTNSTKSWDRYAETKIAMNVTGPSSDPDFVDIGSTYSYEGEEITELPPPCATTIVRTEAGGGPLNYTGDPFKDDIYGYILAQNLSRLQLTVWTRYDVTTDRATCEGTTTTTGRAIQATSMQLEEISSTSGSITYEVESYQADMGLSSPWDSVEGTLTLARNP